MKEILDFLKGLEANNSREWFDLNRDRYDATRKIFLVVAEQLINDIRQFDDEIPVLNPKDCIFRIFRDVRFSKDKLPYKSNYGCFIARGGKKSGFAGYYLHIQPGECFLSGGIYMPPPEYLQAIRQEIYYHPKNYIDLIENKQFKSTYTLEYSDKLKTAPKGYPKDWEHLDLIKNRNYAFGHRIEEDALCAHDFMKKAIELYKIIYPLNRYLNKAVDENIGI
ncbi:MAG TPA: DUF2461 domain-containing protein [Prolixibacteraceae bacterium]